MNEFVPHPGDGPPRNVGILFFERFREVLHRLSEDFQVSRDRILGPGVSEKLVIGYSEVYRRMRSIASVMSLQRRRMSDQA